MIERPIDQLLTEYGESHQNKTNKFIHWICVPAIFFSIIGVLMSLSWPFDYKSVWINWASVVGFFALIYYLRLSLIMSIGFFFILSLTLFLNGNLMNLLNDSDVNLRYACLAIFVLARIGQFIGHNIEGKKPSFFKDIQFLLIGPAWLLHFIFIKLGVKY